jgi:hypothetical protein
MVLEYFPAIGADVKTLLNPEAIWVSTFFNSGGKMGVWIEVLLPDPPPD